MKVAGRAIIPISPEFRRARIVELEKL